MPSMLRIELIGHVGRDPEMRYTPSGQAVTSFSVAHTEQFTSNGETRKKTIWIRVSTWGKLAETCNTSVKKGMLVRVEGKLTGDENGIYMSVSKVHAITRENYTTAKGTAMVNTVIHATVKFTHTSGESIEVDAVGEGSDSGDKSANKAMTGLYKYALRQTFCIETGDDPDKYASEERADPEIVSDELWSRWTALVIRAEKLKVRHPVVERAKVKASKLGELGVELKVSVEAAEAQAKAGENA